MISRLEEELGVPLFDRQGRAIRLNTCGEAFLQHVERIFAELEDGKRELRDLVGVEEGRVVLAAISSYIVGDLLRAFLVHHPQANFDLRPYIHQAASQQLQQGEIDLCLAGAQIELCGLL